MKIYIICVSVVLAIFGFANGFELNPCEGIDDDRFIAHPTSCSSYYGCSGGIATPGECPAGYYFNVVLQWCDWPDRVDCISSTTTNIPDSTTVVSSTDEQTTTEEGTEATTSDQLTTTEENTEAPVVSTTNIESTTETVTEIPTSVCYGIDNNVLVGNSDSCESFFHCVDNFEFPNTCPSGLLFNGVYCDLEERVKCGSETTTEEAPATTTDVLTTEAEEGSTSDAAETEERTTDSTLTPSLCLSNEVTLHPHTSKCGQYILCLGGHEFEMSCRSGEHFSRDEGVCVSREFANCRLEDPECDPIESANSANYFPHPHFCNQFFVCFRGELIDLSCSGGHHWSPDNSQCIPSSESTCI